MADESLPDWSVWGHIPEAALWEAVALSLNVNPDAVEFDYDDNDRPVFNSTSPKTDTRGAEFSKRLKVASRNLGASPILRPKTIAIGCPWKCDVSLADFSHFAESIGWALPAEFPPHRKYKVFSHTEPLKPLTDEQVKTYLLSLRWECYQAMFILHGFVPQCTDGDITGEAFTYFVQATHDLQNDIKSGAFGIERNISGQRLFFETPENYYAWAKNKGLSIDPRIIAHFSEAPAPDELAPAPASTVVDEIDATLGANYRHRMAKMGERRQVEAEVKAKWWEPYIQEGRLLLPSIGSKQRAAEIVAQRHPEAKINAGTLRQKL